MPFLKAHDPIRQFVWSATDRTGDTTFEMAALFSTLGAAVAVVQPRRGRLFVFPHATPHEGRAVARGPKRLLRGELWLPPAW